MELESNIISIDAILGLCVIGELIIGKTGLKPINTCKFPLHRSSIPYGILALGKRAKIKIKDDNTIIGINPCDTGPCISHFASREFVGFVLEKIDIQNRTILFRYGNSKDLYVRAYASPKIQQQALSFLGQKVNFVLSTRDKRIGDRYKSVISVSCYQESGNQLNDYS